jgi:phosphoribosylformylglycinamidine cyclo-ligase
VRSIVEDLDLSEKYAGLSAPLGEVLLTPTKIYAKQVKAVTEKVTVKGISHITGGGFYENFPRMLPSGLGVNLDKAAWKVPEIFTFLQKKGEITETDMYGVFNMGIGMALAVDKQDAEQVLAVLKEQGETAAVIGEVTSEEGVVFHG